MFCCPRGLTAKGGILPSGDTRMIPSNQKLGLSSSHFGLLIPLSQQAKKGVTALPGTDPDYQREIELFHMEVRKRMSGTQVIPQTVS